MAHGSKVKKANETINKIIKKIRDKGGIKIIEPSYLQFCSPNLHASVKKVVAKGSKKIIVLPFFLFMGNHVGRDIPKEIASEARLYKDIEFVYARNIGHDPRIGDIVLDCIREAL